MTIRITIILCLLFHLPAVCAKPPISIRGLEKASVLSQAELKKRDVQPVRMDYNRAYPGVMMTYDGIRLCDLLRDYDINPEHTLEFIAMDNFSVLIPAKYALNCTEKDSVAYLAIEPDSGWPTLFNHTNTTAGPYAIIWTHPERSYISDEYWAWSVTKIVEHAQVDESVVAGPPQNMPPNEQAALLNGYKVYVSHCSSCHTLYQKGQASIGPDLGRPKTVFDYYPDIQQLKKFIRDPQSVRQTPNGRMSGSSYVGLHDDDLDDLIRYFKFTTLSTG